MQTPAAVTRLASGISTPDGVGARLLHGGQHAGTDQLRVVDDVGHHRPHRGNVIGAERVDDHLRGGGEELGPMGETADDLPEGETSERRVDGGDAAVAVAEHVVARDLDVVVQGEAIDLLAGGGDGVIDARLPPARDRLPAHEGESLEVGRHRRPQHALLGNVPGGRRHRDGADVSLRHHGVARFRTVDDQGLRPLLHHPQTARHLGPGELAIGLHVDDHVRRYEVVRRAHVEEALDLLHRLRLVLLDQVTKRQEADGLDRAVVRRPSEHPEGAMGGEPDLGVVTSQVLAAAGHQPAGGDTPSGLRIDGGGDLAGIRLELCIEERGERVDAGLETGLRRDVFDHLPVHDDPPSVPQAPTILLAVAQARVLSIVCRHGVAQEKVVACRRLVAHC